MLTASQARESIAQIIKEERGGVHAFSKEIGVHFTSIYSFLGGGGMSKANAERLRTALHDVDETVWLALRLTEGFAPLPAAEAQP